MQSSGDVSAGYNHHSSLISARQESFISARHLQLRTLEQVWYY